MADKFDTKEMLDRANRKTQIGAGLKTIGSIAGTIASTKSAGVRSAIYRQNENTLRVAAEDTRIRGSQEYQELRKGTALLIGEQKAALAANGILVSGDSAIDLFGQTAGIGAMDALEALDNAEKKARGLLREAELEKTRSELEDSKGTQELLTGLAEAGSTILNSASTINKRNKKFKVKGK